MNGIVQVFCNVRHTSVVGDMIVSRKAHGIAVNQGGTADGSFALDRFLSGAFFMLRDSKIKEQ